MKKYRKSDDESGRRAEGAKRERWRLWPMLMPSITTCAERSPAKTRFRFMSPSTMRSRPLELPTVTHSLPIQYSYPSPPLLSRSLWVTTIDVGILSISCGFRRHVRSSPNLAAKKISRLPHFFFNSIIPLVHPQPFDFQLQDDIDRLRSGSKYSHIRPVSTTST